jgi:hypothetical protein
LTNDVLHHSTCFGLLNHENGFLHPAGTERGRSQNKHPPVIPIERYLSDTVAELTSEGTVGSKSFERLECNDALTSEWAIRTYGLGEGLIALAEKVGQLDFQTPIRHLRKDDQAVGDRFLGTRQSIDAASAPFVHASACIHEGRLRQFNGERSDGVHCLVRTVETIDARLRGRRYSRHFVLAC